MGGLLSLNGMTKVQKILIAGDSTEVKYTWRKYREKAFDLAVWPDFG